MVRDHFVVKAKVEIDFVEKEGGNSLGGDGFLSGAKNHPLRKPMVNHDQERIKAQGERKVSDEVTGDLLERTRGGGLDWNKRGDGRMGICLVLLADSTSFNVCTFIHKMQGQATRIR